MQTGAVYSAEELANQYANSEFGKKRMQLNIEQAKTLQVKAAVRRLRVCACARANNPIRTFTWTVLRL
eukprot:6208645-Pleurochrysis_carterae.AAC.1